MLLHHFQTALHASPIHTIHAQWHAPSAYPIPITYEHMPLQDERASNLLDFRQKPHLCLRRLEQSYRYGDHVVRISTALGQIRSSIFMVQWKSAEGFILHGMRVTARSPLYTFFWWCATCTDHSWNRPLRTALIKSAEIPWVSTLPKQKVVYWSQRFRT